METRFYLSIFPMEALIASQLEPEQFGQYMASGTKNGSYEKTTFIEIEGGFGDFFDWDHAKEQCITHASGEPKHSLWMSIYRTLENVPLDKLRKLHLVTNDGRTLSLDPSPYAPPQKKRDFWVYQELCPIRPLVVSAYDPTEFSQHMTHPDVKVHVPTIAFCDLKVIDFDNLEDTGNVGSVYDTNLDHLKQCIRSVTSDGIKKVKNVERSRTESVGYQTISKGVYIGHGTNVVEYSMPSTDEIRKNHYDWGRSAMIL